MRKHNYKVQVDWTGNKGSGTFDYRSYSRDHTILVENKPHILSSADPSFRGDPSRYNPEDLFIASVSACHMLWYLHLCSDNGIIVTEYRDEATGVMVENQDGSGQFDSICLHPVVLVTEKSMIEKAIEIHEDANKMCFIANSLNIEVKHEPVVKLIS